MAGTTIHNQIRHAKQDIIAKLTKLTNKLVNTKNSEKSREIISKIEALNDTLNSVGRLSE